VKIHITQLQKARRQAGFTLVEIIVVMTIIMILSGGAIFMIKGLVGDAQGQRVQDDIRTLTTLLDNYERKNYFKPPTEQQGLRALVEMPTTDPKPKSWTQYLEELPLDPWGQEYQYRYPAKKSGKKYDLFSLGEDGVESEDDIGNWE